MSPVGEELPRLPTEEARYYLEELLGIKNEDIIEILVVHNKFDDLVRVLLPLEQRQVPDRKLLTIQEHLDDPQELVARVNIRFLNLVAALSVDTLHGTDILFCDLTRRWVALELQVVLALFVPHVLVHHLQDVLASGIAVCLSCVKIQESADHAIGAA